MKEQLKGARSAAPKEGKRGKFITLEGGEGCGKTTLSHRLHNDINKHLKALKRQCLLMREPGGLYGDEDSVANHLRSILLFPPKSASLRDEMELHLFLTSQYHNIDQTIEPALARGDWVICDRFCDSTLCYQGYGRFTKEPNFAFVESCWRRVLMRQTPDLTLFLDLDPATGLTRAKHANPRTDRFEKRALAFHTRVRQGYKNLQEKYPKRIELIDAGLDPQEVNKKALELIAKRLF